jgi:predicted DNA-binding transcriptional regulator AlpA
MQADDTLLNIRQVAELLGVSHRSVERYVYTRVIPRPLRLGKQSCLRWRRSSIMAFLAKREAAAQKESAHE